MIPFFLLCINLSFAQDSLQCPNGMQSIQGEVGFVSKKKAHHFCIDQFEFPNIEGRFPTVNITWNEAKNLCKSVNKRLCTDGEWELACSDSGHWKYPYGPDYDDKKCNTHSSTFGKSGEYRECVGSWKIFDLSGNVREWTAGGGVGSYGGYFNSRKGSNCKNWEAHSLLVKKNSIGFRCCKEL